MLRGCPEGGAGIWTQAVQGFEAMLVSLIWEASPLE